MRALSLLALSVFLLSMSYAQTSRRDSANSYLERGNQWLKKGEVERAIEDFSLAVSSDPTLDQAYFNRGVARERKGDSEGALGDYNKALQLNPIAPIVGSIVGWRSRRRSNLNARWPLSPKPSPCNRIMRKLLERVVWCIYGKG